MLRDKWFERRHIQHQIKRFAIDITPVTNAEFAKFLNATKWKPKHAENFLKLWTSGKRPADHPVVHVGLDDARAYARWAAEIRVDANSPGSYLWNEVEIGAAQWDGNSEDYYRLYAMVVSHFKSAGRRIELVLQNLPWTGSSTSELLLLDQERNLERVRKEEHNADTIKIVQDLPAPGILLVYVRSSH